MSAKCVNIIQNCAKAHCYLLLYSVNMKYQYIQSFFAITVIIKLKKINMKKELV